MSATYTRSNPAALATVKRGGYVTMAQVVAVESARKYVYLSGQVARDTEGRCTAPGDMRAQIIQVAENIKAGLKEAGATFDNVVKSNTYVTNMAEYLKHADLRSKYFCNPISASTTVEVKGLVHPDFMIEIEVVAML